MSENIVLCLSQTTKTEPFGRVACVGPLKCGRCVKFFAFVDLSDCHRDTEMDVYIFVELH